MKNFLFFIALIGFLSFQSCSFTKQLFSEGKEDLGKAKKALFEKNYAEALEYASIAVLKDTNFVKAKEFFHENFETANQQIQTELSQLAKSSAVPDAERRYFLLEKLFNTYTNLAKVGMPFAHPKGKWSWETKMVDYSGELYEARKFAYEVIYKSAKEMLSKDQLEEAYTAYKKAYGKYTLAKTPEREAAQKAITADLNAFAAKFKNMKTIEQVKIAYDAYSYALYFNSKDDVANAGKTFAANSISVLYFKEGQGHEAKGNVEAYITAVASYENSLKWNKENAQSQKSLAQVKEKIAEHYYAKGRELEAQGGDIPTIVAQYKEVQKWVPKYKDSIRRMYMVPINSELIALRKNLKDTRTEFNRLNSRIGSIQNNVNKADDALNSLTYVSTNVRQLNNDMKNVANTLAVFKVIPTVGTVTGITAKAIDRAQKPVGKLVHKLDAVERPIITPTKTAVSKIKTGVDQAHAKMASASQVIKSAEETIARIEQCMEGVEAESNFKQAELAVKELNKGLKGTNDELRKTNNSIDVFAGTMADIGKIANPANKIKSGINTIKPVVSKVTGTVNELNKVLDEKFTLNLVFKKYTFSVKQILTGLPGAVKAIMGAFSDLAMKALDPVLKALKIDVPTIPGLDEMERELSNIQANYTKITNEATKFQNSVKSFANYEAKVKANLNKLIAATGCGNAI